MSNQNVEFEARRLRPIARPVKAGDNRGCSLVKKSLRTFVFGAVVGWGLVSSGVALGQSGAGLSDGGAATSPTLGEFLRAHRRLELLAPGVTRFSLRFWAERVLIEDGKVFSLMAGPKSACSAPLRVQGNRASGSCLFSVERSDGAGSRQVGFRFGIVSRSVSADRLVYDVDGFCVGETCLRGAELCWQSTGDAEMSDCTLRPIYKAPKRATPARVQEFLAMAGESGLELIYQCRDCAVDAIELHPDRSFFVRDPGNSMFPCGGKWVVDGLHIRGRCANERKDLEGSFDFLVDGVTEGGVTFEAHHCVPGPGDCSVRRGGFWLPQGGRDRPGGMAVELIQGAKRQEMLSAVELRLRGARWSEWKEASVVPALLRGLPARHSRVETEIFYAADDASKRLAEVTARLLAPVVGVVEPRPWPGSAGSAVVVVVGEKVAAGGGKGE